MEIISRKFWTFFLLLALAGRGGAAILLSDDFSGTAGNLLYGRQLKLGGGSWDNWRTDGGGWMTGDFIFASGGGAVALGNTSANEFTTFNAATNSLSLTNGYTLSTTFSARGYSDFDFTLGLTESVDKGYFVNLNGTAGDVVRLTYSVSGANAGTFKWGIFHGGAQLNNDSSTRTGSQPIYTNDVIRLSITCFPASGLFFGAASNVTQGYLISSSGISVNTPGLTNMNYVGVGWLNIVTNLSSASSPAKITSFSVTNVNRTISKPLVLATNLPPTMTAFAFDDFSSTASTNFPYVLSEHAPIDTMHAVRDSVYDTVRVTYPAKTMIRQLAWGGSAGLDLTTIYPGHCLLKLGTKLTNTIAAVTDDTVLYLGDYTRVAASQSGVDSITNSIESYVLIYALTNGRPDWSRAEHVRLKSVDTTLGTVTVQRGQLGSTPLAFTNGLAVVARHMMFWTDSNGGQWEVNLSMECPRGGPFNMTAAEWFAMEIANRIFSDNAEGVEFDVGRWQWGYPANNPMDCNNDLIADYGYINGICSFGVGGQLMLKRLRELLGPNKIIQRDGDDAQFGQRGWQYANGVQLESFPTGGFDTFSEKFSHLRMWVSNVTTVPAFSYPFTKCPTTYFGHVLDTDGSNLDWHFRVGFAAALLTGMPHPFASITDKNFDPQNPDYNDPNMVTDKGFYKWDEYVGGTNDLNSWKWLGAPTAAPLQVTNDMTGPNLLASTVWTWIVETNFVATTNISGGIYSASITYLPSNTIPWDSTFYSDGITPKTLWMGTRLAAASGMPSFEPGKEYTLEFEAQGNDSWTNGTTVLDKVPRSLTIHGIANKGNNNPVAVFVDSTWRSYRISIIADSVAPPPLIFGVSEQIGNISVRNISLHKGGAERWVRPFTNGIVLLNMTKEPWSFASPVVYRRFSGTQNPNINNGQRVPPNITVPVWDALFLVRMSGTNIIVPAGITFNFSPGGLLLGTNDSLSGCGGVMGNVLLSSNAVLFAGTNSLMGGVLSFSNNLTLNGQALTFNLSTNPASGNDKFVVVGNVTNIGVTTISLNYLSGYLGAGTYTLMTYASRQGGNFALDAGYPNVTLNVGTTNLTLTVGAGGSIGNQYVWHGTYASNAWDIATSANWKFNGQEVTYQDGIGVLFDDPSVSFTANLNTTVSPGSMTVNAQYNSYTISGTGGISGSTSLIKTGTNQLTLATTNNSYIGGTLISAGTLSGTTSSLQGIITNNGVLQFNQTTDGTFSGVISGSGDLDQAGTGKLTLTANNTYAGNTILENNGDIIVYSDANLGAGTNITINSSANLRTRASFATSKGITLIGANPAFDVTNGTTLTVNGAISSVAGTTPKKQTGTGMLVLNGSNSFAPNTLFTVTAGGISLGNPAALNNAILKFNSSSATLDNTSGGTMVPTGLRDFILTSSFTFLGTDDLDLSAVPSGFTQTVGGVRTITVTAKTLKMSGLLGAGVDANGTSRTDGGLSKAGAGTLVLTGISAYTNTTTVSAGTLLVNGTLPASPVTVSGGATLGGSGIITGAVTMANSTTLLPGGSNAVGTLSFSNNLTLGSSDTLGFDITNNTGNADKIVVAGNLTNNSLVTVSLRGMTPVPNGTYTLMEVAGAVTGTNNFSVSSPPGKTYTIVYQAGTPNKILLQVGGTPTAKTWTGGTGASSNWWDVNASLNWVETAGNSTPYVFTNNNTVLFDDTGATNPVVNITTTVSPASMTVNSASNYTFVGSGFIAGTNAITKSGSGTLTLSNASTFTGGITVNAGTLALGLTNAAGKGVLTLNDGSRLQSANTTGTVVVTNAVVLNGSVSLAGAGDLTVRGPVGGSGSLTVPAGAGLTLSLTNANSYSGGTTNASAAGRISVFNVRALGSGPLVLNGGQMYWNNDLKRGNAGAGVTNDIVVLAGGSFNFLASDTLLSGRISGSGSIAASGQMAGIGTLSGDNSAWSGNFSMRDATLLLGHTNCLGSGVLTLQGSNLTLGVATDLTGGGVPNNIVLQATNSVSFNLGYDLTLSGVISDGAGFSSALVKSGVGALTLTGTNTCAGNVLVSGGTLQLAAPAGVTSLLSNSPSIAVTSDAILDVSRMTDGFSVVSNQTLSGGGTVTGNVAVVTGGVLSPGINGIGTLTANNALALSGRAIFEINKTGAVLTNDRVVGLEAVAYGGALTVTNTGQALAGGEVFQLFAAAGYSNSFSMLTLPPLAGGLFWDASRLSVDGSIVVLAQPVATNQAVTTLEDTPTNLVLTASDVDSPSLTYSILTGPTIGSLGMLNTNSGAVTYSPNLNISGADSFTFRVFDGSLYATGTVSIIVAAVNDPPVATNQSVTTLEDTATNLVLTASDIDSAGLVYSILTSPANGSLGTLNANSGAVTYLPNTNYNGADSFTFRVFDGSLYATGTVSITVVAVNDAPMATNQVLSIMEDTATNLVLTASDVEGQGLIYSVLTGPVNGTLGALNANSGAVTYLPNTNYNGADSFTFRVSDGSLYATGTVSITVVAVNDPPVATNQNVTTPEITATNLVLTAGDVDSAGLTYSILTGPGNGTLGTLNTNSGAVTYTPTVNFNGADSFTFRVFDGSLYATGTVNLAVTVRAANVWRGDGSANLWDVGVSTNWLFSSQPAVFVDGAKVLFDDTATNFTVNLNGTVSPGKVTVNASSNYTFSGSGKISGVAALLKDGTGQLTLNTTNVFNGGTTIAAGTLRVGATNLTGNITNQGVLLFNQVSDGTFSGVISGAGSLSKQGGGILTLSGNNTFAGGITLSNGSGNVLSVASDANLGSGTNITINQNANLRTTASLATSKTITFAGVNPNLSPSVGTTLTLNGALGGSSLSPVHNGAGALTLNASNSFASGSLFLVGTANGSLNLGNSNALRGTTLKFNAGNLSLDNTSGSAMTMQGMEGLEFVSAAGVTFVGSSDLDLSGAPASFCLLNNTKIITVSSNKLTFGGILSTGTNAAGEARSGSSLVKAGNGLLVINGPSDYWGSTTVSNGTLKIGDPLALGFGFNVTTNVGGTTNYAVIDFNGQSPVNEALVFAAGSVLTNSAAGTVVIGNGLAGIAIISGGSGYSNVPSITVAPPLAGGITAIAKAYLGVTGASFKITNGTTTYSKLPDVTISGGGGTNAFAIAVTNASGLVTNVLITNPGYGFTSTPTITFSSPNSSKLVSGTDPTGGGNASNFVVSAVSYTPGSGYTSVPSVTVGSGNASMTATLSAVNLAGNATLDSGGGNLTIAAVISGAGALTNSGSGTLTLGGANIYSGNTVAKGGILLVNGSLASGSAVTVNNGATLGGAGIIGGPVTVVGGGTLQPGLGGADTSPLAITNTLNLAGTTLIVLNRTNASKASTITNIATLTLGGTLTVTNVGADLAAGDTFKLFAAMSVSGSFGTTNLPALTGDLTWDTSQLTNGVVTVVSPATNPPVFLPAYVAGTNLVLSGSNGTFGNQYFVLTTTNIGLPRSNWTVLATNFFAPGGRFSFTNRMIPGEPDRYFILQLP